METKKEVEKSIYELKLHEGLKFKGEFGGDVEVLRVAGGFCYMFDFPGWRQAQVVFVPFSNEFMDFGKKK